ncbi:MAG: YbbR-like domain-containing protein [Candidatus Cloacimonetes bacterium]|nr:YbbR-like domain-containing protein [Candidatus Cloacimonadota bacterium]
MIRHNIGLKIFSLLIALFIWLQSVLVSEHKTTIHLPVNLTNLPAHVALNNIPKSIPFFIRGKGIDLIRLIIKQVNVDIDAGNIRAGAIQIPITNYQINLPENLDVEILKPAYDEKILVQTDVYDHKTVPVELIFNSTAARNIYQSGRYRYQPETVSIHGPRKILDQIKQVRTQALSPTMLNQASVIIELEPPAANVSILESSITIEMLDEDIQQRIFANIPLRLDSGRQVTPNRVSIKIEGVKEVIQTLNATDFRARVLPEADQSGYHEVVVEIPDKVRLIDVTPARVFINETN